MADDVQGVDNTDDEATERAIAAAITSAVLSTDPSSGDDSMTRPAFGWLEVMRSVVGAVIAAYAMRVAVSFLRSSPASEAVWLPRARERANEATEETLQRLADHVEEQVINLSKERVGTTATRGTGTTAGEINDRVRIGGQLLATEVVTAARESIRYELAFDLGAVRKTWRTKRDNRVRISHGALEGESIPIGQPFVTINGVMLMFPGDPSASINETARCRCRLGYVLPRRIGVPT